MSGTIAPNQDYLKKLLLKNVVCTELISVLLSVIIAVFR